MREGLLEVRQRRSRLHRGVGQGPRKYPIPVNLLDDIEDSWNIFVDLEKKKRMIDTIRFRNIPTWKNRLDGYSCSAVYNYYYELIKEIIFRGGNCCAKMGEHERSPRVCTRATIRGRCCWVNTRFAIESVAANAVSPFKGGPALIITYCYSFAPLCAATMAENRGLASFSPRVSTVYRLSGYGFRVRVT